MSDEHSELVTLSLNEAVLVGDHLWELPSWHTYWGRFVYPLLVANSQRRLFPLGTAFAFSNLGHVLTARHNLEEALRKHHPNAEQFVRQGMEAARSGGGLEHTHLAIFSQGPNPRLGDISLDLRVFSSIHAAPPTDLLIGSILADDSSALVPTMHPLITFAPPRIGEIVRCVGYTDMTVPEGGLSIDDIREGRLNPYEAYGHRLIVAVGRVKNIFIERLARGFVEGPCFTIDVDVPHGLSGGPILRSDGAVCGAVYSGAGTFFDSPTTVGALLYPIFLLPLSFGISMANGVVLMKATERPIAELVATQAIRTDGTEEEQLVPPHLYRRSPE
ncbi:MAG TPA: trypsin-like peptidase domain-containing protein [Thermoanaerobaculia bacterium]|nr:trypsin-like peptidase domain-containing protein [Thermoanaerobaculia bacterium]